MKTGGLLLLITILVACSRVLEPVNSSGQTEAVSGFQGRIAGSYEGEFAGSGVLMWLPEGGVEGLGYFFLADGQGLRPHGVTFILPPDLGPGRHVLASPTPLDIGTVPSVRVDRDLGTSVVSYQEKTTGSLDLITFDLDSSDRRIEGEFQFSTENRAAERISVTGSFAFSAPPPTP